MDLKLSMLNPAEADAVIAVVKESFEACVAPDYAQQGRDLFAQVVTADYLCSLPHRQGFTIVAKLDGRMVGMCALRDGHHVTLFFVLPNSRVGESAGDCLTLPWKRVRRNVSGAQSWKFIHRPCRARLRSTGLFGHRTREG